MSPQSSASCVSKDHAGSEQSVGLDLQMHRDMDGELLTRLVSRRGSGLNSLYGTGNPLCSSVLVEAEVDADCSLEHMHAKMRVDLITV